MAHVHKNIRIESLKNERILLFLKKGITATDVYAVDS